MTQTIPVKNVARRPVDIEGGRLLAHGEQAEAPDCEHTRAQVDAGLLALVNASPEGQRTNPAEEA